MKIYLLVLLLIPFFGNTQDTTNLIQNDSAEIQYFEWVDTDATFPGGNLELMKFVTSNLDLSQCTVTEQMRSTVYISCIIDSTGAMRHLNIDKGSVKEFNDVVITMLRKMPNWIPATIAGKNVNSIIRLPITITFD